MIWKKWREGFGPRKRMPNWFSTSRNMAMVPGVTSLSMQVFCFCFCFFFPLSFLLKKKISFWNFCQGISRSRSFVGKKFLICTAFLGSYKLSPPNAELIERWVMVLIRYSKEWKKLQASVDELSSPWYWTRSICSWRSGHHHPTPWLVR